MDTVTLKNKAPNASPLILPTGEVIPANGSAAVPKKSWDKAKDNRTVKAWIESGALKVGKGGSDESSGDTQQGGSNTGATDAENEARLRAMTIPELTKAIEDKGGKDRIKSGMTKDDLVKIATEIGA